MRARGKLLPLAPEVNRRIEYPKHQTRTTNLLRLAEHQHPESKYNFIVAALWGSTCFKPKPIYPGGVAPVPFFRAFAYRPSARRLSFDQTERKKGGKSLVESFRWKDVTGRRAGNLPCAHRHHRDT